MSDDTGTAAPKWAPFPHCNKRDECRRDGGCLDSWRSPQTVSKPAGSPQALAEARNAFADAPALDYKALYEQVCEQYDAQAQHFVQLADALRQALPALEAAEAFVEQARPEPAGDLAAIGAAVEAVRAALEGAPAREPSDEEIVEMMNTAGVEFMAPFLVATNRQQWNVRAQSVTAFIAAARRVRAWPGEPT